MACVLQIETWDVMRTACHYYRVPRDQIAFLRFIFEAYDGIALLRTLDPRLGVIAVHIAPGCQTDVNALLNALRGEIRIEPWQEPPDG